MLARRLGFLIRLAVCSATVLLFAVPVVAVAATSAVTIADFSFSPSQVTVNAGDTVRWTNNGPSPHTTTSTSGVWDSGTLAPGQTFSFTFTTAGTFAYHCTIHPQMTGTIHRADRTARHRAACGARTSYQRPGTDDGSGERDTGANRPVTELQHRAARRTRNGRRRGGAHGGRLRAARVGLRAAPPIVSSLSPQSSGQRPVGSGRSRGPSRAAARPSTWPAIRQFGGATCQQQRSRLGRREAVATCGLAHGSSRLRVIGKDAFGGLRQSGDPESASQLGRVLEEMRVFDQGRALSNGVIEQLSVCHADPMSSFGQR